MLATTETNIENTLTLPLPAPEVIDAYMGQKIPGIRKAAILCLSLGEEVASVIFSHLEEDEVQMITKELATMQSVGPDITEGVIEEFRQLLLAKKYVTLGGVDYAKRLLIKSFGAEVAKRLMDKVITSLERSSNFEILQKIDPIQISKLFHAEQPQTIAVVLAHVDPTMASNILQNLPEAQRGKVALRLANMQNVSQETIKRISQLLDQKISSFNSGLSSNAVGGLRSLADICNRLDRDTSSSILEDIETVDPELATQVRNLMVTFDDVLMLDDLGIREIIQRIDKKVLTLALKGTNKELQDRFFSNMSARAMEMMLEELEFMGQVKMKDVNVAQRAVVDVMRELDELGLISLSGQNPDEQYVT